MNKGIEARLKMLARSSLKRSQEHDRRYQFYKDWMVTSVIMFGAFITTMIWSYFTFDPRWSALALLAGSITFWEVYKRLRQRARRERGYLKLYAALCKYTTSALIQKNASPFVLAQALKGYNFLECRTLNQDLLVTNDSDLQSRTTNIG